MNFVPIYWLKKFRKKRLKITTLNSQWCDQDEVLLHACFQTLTNFIEKEEPQGYNDWEYDQLHSTAWAELTRLYNWWTVRRPKRDMIHDKLFNGIERPGRIDYWNYKDEYPEYNEAMNKYSELLDKQEKEDQDNLKSLIEFRGFMWT